MDPEEILRKAKASASKRQKETGRSINLKSGATKAPSSSITDVLASVKGKSEPKSEEEAPIDMEEGTQGFMQNVGRGLAGLTLASSAAAWDMASLFDVGDWHHYLPDTESKDFKEFMDSGNAGVATYSNLALSSLSKWIDNEIGDGEFEVGNFATRNAAKLRETNEIYNQVNSGYKGLDYGVNMSVNVIGSILGNLGGAGVARGLVKSGANGILSVMGGAMSATAATGGSIAEGVYDETLNYTLEQNPIYAEQKTKLFEDSKKEYLAQNKDVDGPGELYGNAEMHAREQVKAFRESYLNENQDIAENARQMAIIGADTSIKANTASFFFNLATSKLGIKGATPASKTFKGVPKKWGEVADYVTEGLQEVVEEAVIENVAENWGKAAGRGEQYSYEQAKADVAESGLESAFWAVLGSSGTTAGINLATHKSRLKQAQPAMDAIKKQDAIMKASGGTGLSDLIELSRSTQDIVNIVRKRDKLAAEGKVDEAEIENNKIRENQAKTSFKTGTTDNLRKVYEHLAQDENNSDEERSNAQKAIVELTKLEEIYNEAHDKGYSNADEIYTNQAQDHSLSRYDAELDTKIALAKTKAATAILSGRKTGELPSLKVTKKRGEGTVLEDLGIDPNYEEELDFDMDDLTSESGRTFFKEEKDAVRKQQGIIDDSKDLMKDPAYQDEAHQIKFKTRIADAELKLQEAKEEYAKVKSKDEEYSKTHKGFINAAKQNIEAVRELQKLQDSKENTQQAIHDGKKVYNELTSSKHQKMLGHKNKLLKSLGDNILDIQDAMLTDPHFEKTLDKFMSPYKGLVPKEMLDQLKQVYLNNQKDLKKADKKQSDKAIENVAKTINPKEGSQESKDNQAVTQQEQEVAAMLDGMYEGDMDPNAVEEVNATTTTTEIPPSTLGDNTVDTMQASSNLMSVLGDVGGLQFGNVTPPSANPMDEVSDSLNDETAEGLEAMEGIDASDLLSDPLEVKEGMSQEQVQAIQDGIAQYKEVLDSTLERPATFEDFVRDFIKTQGREKADKFFKVLVKGWELNQFPVAKYQDVYNNLFKTTKEVGASLIDLFQGSVHEVNSVEDSEFVHEKMNEEPLAKEVKPDHITVDNEPVVDNLVHEGFTTNETDNKLNFKSKSTKKVIDPDTGVVKHIPTSEGLNEGSDLTGLHKLLDPDEYLPGTELQGKIPPDSERDGIIITLYDGAGNVRQSLPFGQWVANNGIVEGSQEWLDHVPIMFYDSDGDTVAFVHDAGWYNKQNFREVSRGDIELAKKNARSIRQAAYDGGKEGVVVEITSKSSGTYESSKIPNDQPRISLKEGDPNNMIAIYNKDTGKFQTKGEDGKLVDFDGIFENKETLPFTTKGGQKIYNYQIRRTGTQIIDGKKVPTYTAFHVVQPSLQEGDVDNMIKAMELFTLSADLSLKGTPNGTNVSNTIEQIMLNTGMDISTIQGLENYLKRFVILGNPEIIGRTNGESIANAMEKQLAGSPPGKPWMVTQDKVIYFGVTGQFMTQGYTTKNGTVVAPKKASYINSGMMKTPKGAAQLRKGWNTLVSTLKNKVLPLFNQNISREGVQYNKPMMDIEFDPVAKVFSAKTASESYDEHLQNNLQTNLRSFNIGTAQEPKHVTRLQPVITYRQKGVNENKVVETTPENINEGNEVVKEAEKKVEEAPVTETVKELTPKEKQVNEVAEGKIEELNNELEEKRQEVVEIEDSPLQQTANEVQTEIIEDKIEVEKAKIVEPTVVEEKKNLPQFSEEQIAETKQQAMEDTSWISDDDFNVMYDPVEITDGVVSEMVADMLKIPGLASHHQYQLVDFIFNQLASSVDFGSKVDKKIVMFQVTNQLENLLNKIRTDYSTRRDILATSKNDEEAQKLVGKYEAAIAYINNIEKHKATIAKDGLEKVYKYTGIKETKGEEESEIDDTTGKEKIYSKTFLEDSGKDSSSYRIKRFLSGIQDIDGDGNPVTGFLGTASYLGFDDMFNTLQAVLANSSPDLDQMIDILQMNVEALPFLDSVIKKLKEADSQIQNEFASLMSRNTMSMEFVMYSFNKTNGTYSLQIYNSNSSSIVDTIRKKWYNNLTKSGGSKLIKIVNGEYHIDKEKASELLDEFNSFRQQPVSVTSATKRAIQSVIPTSGATFKGGYAILKDNPRDNAIKAAVEGGTYKFKNDTTKIEYKVTLEDGNKLRVSPLKKSPIANLMNGVMDVDGINILQDWLSNFGVELSKGTVAELVNKGLYHSGNTMEFKDMFDRSKSKNNSSLFGALADFLGRYTEATEDTALENEVNNPLKQGVFKSLAKLESRYNKTITPSAFRDAGKNIQGYTVSKFMTDRALKLKGEDGTVREQLKNTSFTKHSMWLTMMEDPKFREKFEVTHLGINAIKEFGKKLYRDNGVTTLADADHELTKLGCFMDMKQGVTEDYKGFKTRVARMFAPTMSDKTTMTLIKTGVIDLQKMHFKIENENGVTKIKARDTVLDIMYNQLIKPELDRMHNFHSKVKGTNIKGYDKGAKLFLMFPQANNLMIKNSTAQEGDKKEIRLIDAIAKDPDKFSMEWIQDNMGGEIKAMLQKYLDAELANKLKVWEENGYLTIDASSNITGFKFLDHNYMSKWDSLTDPGNRVQHAALDYIINSLISNSNSFATMAGDPALYFKSGASDLDFVQMSKDTFSNVSKRLANQIAPGNKLTGSDSNQYLQVFLNDSELHSSNLPFLTQLLDGKEFDQETWNSIMNMAEDSDAQKKAKKASKKAFAKLYPETEDYFAIEGADAQEYTTWKEHLHILEKLGKTADSMLDVKPSDIRRAREIFAAGTPLDQLSNSDRAIVKMVMQPMKPVYTGQIFDAEQDTMRTVYIKSSSFPLIPQMTKGLQIDKLRNAMEALENKHTDIDADGNKLSRPTKTVRAVYQSGVKVGGITNPLNVLNDYSGDTNELSVENLEASSLTLDRSNFRIQQTIPFKAGKKKADLVTLGTQTTKIIFGDGVTEMEGFQYKGKTLNGKELQQEYKTAFDRLLNHKRNQLYDELGIDKTTGQPKDIIKSAKKIQQILKDEAEGRGYSKQVVESLTMTEVRDTNGNLTDITFNLPLWMSAESNRFESLLNAIVTNRIAKVKMPGNSYVLGSQEGFKQVNELDNYAGDKSKIVFTSKWEGELKAAEFYPDGSLKKTQVLLPARFRDNDGKMIDMFTMKDGEYLYVQQDEKGAWKLKEDMFGDDLLSNISFRIPTSAHLSMVDVEIVGILPAEAGDLMIVPRNLVVQIGLDFDVDKNTNYQYWHTQKEDGSFESVDGNSTEIEMHLNNAKDLLNDLKEYAESEITSDEIDELQEKVDAYEEIGFIAPAKLLKGVIANQKKELKDLNKQDITEQMLAVKQLEEYYTRVLQNDIIRATSSVLTNPKMQKKINGVLSIAYAKQQSRMIEEMIDARKKVEGGDSSNYFTPLSDEYQKANMVLGASGQIGIGAYSTDVVFHSLVQQNDAGMDLTETILVNGVPVLRNKSIRFGNIVSGGKLGEMKTLLGDKTQFYISELKKMNGSGDINNLLQFLNSGDQANIDIGIGILEGQAKENPNSIYGDMVRKHKSGQRSISQVLMERQNIATDNAKETVMSKVNLGPETLDVDKVLVLLGFDKGEDGNSIPFLFMSQPIIRDFVKMIANASANTAEFSSTKEQDVIDKLKEKYGFMDKLTPSQKDHADKMMTNAMLTNQIKTGGSDGFFQMAVLHKFLDLKAYGKHIRKVQGTINVDSKGIGKSTFDAIDKLDKLESLPDNEFLSNASTLVGDYVDGNDLKQEEIQNLLDKGYVKAKRYYIKPTTVAGSFSVNTLVTADQLWSKYFPYDSNVMNNIFGELTKIMGTKDGKMVEAKQQIVQEMKKYVNSSEMNLYTLSPQEERSRLFIDSDSNQSLSGYLSEQVDSIGGPHQKAIKAFIKKNKLIERFEFDLNKNGNISTIKFNNAVGENFDEDQLYNSLLSLMDNPIPLPNYNGKPYNTRLLAQDLINYAILEGGVQKAIQFSKFIPISFLNQSGYSANSRGIDFNNDNGSLFGVHLNKPEGMDHLVSNFTMQFAQHNPEKMPKVTKNDFVGAVYENNDGKNLSSLESFNLELNEGEKPSTFVSVYDSSIPKGSKKFHLFYFNGDNYQKIPVKGTFGMSEYNAQVGSQIEDSIVTPKVAKKVTKVTKVTAPVKQSRVNAPHSLNDGNIQRTIDSIAKAGYPGLSDMARALSPFVDGNVNLVVADLNGRGRGVYNPTTNTIGIDSQQLLENSDEDTARTIVHEYVHSITVNELKKYVTFKKDSNGKDTKQIDFVNDGAPPYIDNLVRMFNKTSKHFETELGEVYRKMAVKEPLTAHERRVVYGGSDIFEFLTLATSSPEFQAEMSQVPYAGHLSIVDKFKQVMKQVLEGVGVTFASDSIAVQAINETFKLLEGAKQEKSNTFEITSKDSNEDLKNEVDETLEVFGGEQGQVVVVGNQKMLVKSIAPDDIQIYYEDGELVRGDSSVNLAIIKYHHRPGGDGAKRRVDAGGHQFYVLDGVNGPRIINMAIGNEVLEFEFGESSYETELRETVLNEFAGKMGFLEGTQVDPLGDPVTVDGESYFVTDIGFLAPGEFGVRDIDNKNVLDKAIKSKAIEAYKKAYEESAPNVNDPFGAKSPPSDISDLDILDPNEMNEVEELINEFENTCK